MPSPSREAEQHSETAFRPLPLEVVQVLTAVLPSIYHHPPPGRVERSEGRVEHQNQRVTLPGPGRSGPPKGRVK